MDGLNHLPVEVAHPEGEEAAVLVQTLPSGEAAQQADQELHRVTDAGVGGRGGGDALWKLLWGCFLFKLEAQKKASR